MPNGIWRGVIRKVVTGGYLVEIPRLSTGRVYGSATHPLTYPTAFFGGQTTLIGTDPQGGTVTITASPLTVGQAVLVGFLENNPDQPVILRPA